MRALMKGRERAGLIVAGALTLAAVATVRADLTGTTMDITIDHTGGFGFTESFTHTYGTSQNVEDPGFPQFFMVFSTPAGTAGYDHSILIDFTDFAYDDFGGETGSILVENIAEDVDEMALGLVDENGGLIGTISGSGDTFNGSWAVDDVLSAGTGTMLFIAWSSAPPLTPQPKAGDPLHGLTTDELLRWEVGGINYNTQNLVEDGLGPVFNKESCGNCHNSPLGGPGSQTVTRFGREDKGSFDPLEQFGGSLLQAQAIDPDCAEELQPEVNRTSPRVTNGMMGYGLVESIADADIQFNADNPPSGDVSGRTHIVELIEDPGTFAVGRFGWKAQVATLLSFSADAALMEVGLTSPFLMEENDPNGVRPPELVDCDTVPDPEVDIPFLETLEDFQRFLAQPPQTPKSGMIGETHFNAIGCADCHVAQFTTRDDPLLEDALRNKVIRPYSDFLLHDMGAAADFIPQGDATERELKTPPLWGIRFRDPIWHDGTIGGGTFAERMNEAIERHGALFSEGIPSFTAYDALSETQKAELFAFLDSLGKREFDANGDDEILLDDFGAFLNCMGSGITPDDPCAVHDIDQDGDVDETDYESFLLAYEGPADDCNENGELDLDDIISGASDDFNRNGVPDECEACVFADIDGSGAVDFLDLLAVLSAWGPCVDCPEDIDHNGQVGFNDLLIVLATWGPCNP